MIEGAYSYEELAREYEGQLLVLDTVADKLWKEIKEARAAGNNKLREALERKRGCVTGARRELREILVGIKELARAFG